MKFVPNLFVVQVVWVAISHANIGPPLTSLVMQRHSEYPLGVEPSEGPSSSAKAKMHPIIHRMHVTSHIEYRFANTIISNRVGNPANFPQEVTFSVTLPDTAYISKFLMEMDGKVYEASVKEKQEAKQEYDAAVSAGLGAAHVAVSARDSNRFTVSVNVEPAKKVNFNLTYEELLARRLGAYNHVINLDPGQVVADLRVDVYIKENTNITTLRVPELRSGNEVDADETTAANQLARIDRPSGREAHVSFAPSEGDQKRVGRVKGFDAEGGSLPQAEPGLGGQFVVQYDVDRSEWAGEVLVNDGFFVHFFAPAELAPLPKHAIFVLDLSGSMAGGKLDQLKRAMDAIFGELREGDIFSVLHFRHEVAIWALEEFSPHYRGVYKSIKAFPVTDKYIAEAKKRIWALDARGGTNIGHALRMAVSVAREVRQRREGEVRHGPVILFLTDGEPTEGETNLDNILRNVGELNGDHEVPIFSLAFGDDADHDFLKKLSLRNSGFARKIYEASDAALQLRDFYRQISSPLLANVTFSYQPDKVDALATTRTRYHTFYNGSEIIVAGKMKSVDGQNYTDIQIQGEISARNKAGDQVVRLPDLNPVVQKKIDSGPSLERLWAYLTIRQLLDEETKRSAEVDALGALLRPEVSVKDGSGEPLGQGLSPKERALRLALQYSFVTPLTSLVIVKPNSTADSVQKSVKVTQDYMVNPRSAQKKTNSIGYVGAGNPLSGYFPGASLSGPGASSNWAPAQYSGSQNYPKPVLYSGTLQSSKPLPPSGIYQPSQPIPYSGSYQTSQPIAHYSSHNHPSTYSGSYQTSQPVLQSGPPQSSQTVLYSGTYQPSQPDIPSGSLQASQSVTNQSNINQGYQHITNMNSAQPSYPVALSNSYTRSQPVPQSELQQSSPPVAYSGSYQPSQSNSLSGLTQISQHFAHTGTFQSSQPIKHSGSYQPSQSISYLGNHQPSPPVTYSTSLQNPQLITQLRLHQPSYTEAHSHTHQMYQPAEYSGSNQNTKPVSNPMTQPFAYSNSYHSSSPTNYLGINQPNQYVPYSNINQNFHPVTYPSTHQNTQHIAYPSTHQNTHSFAYPSTHQNTQPNAYPSTQQNSQPFAYPSTHQNTQRIAYPSTQQNSHSFAYPSTHQNTQSTAYPSTHQNTQPNAYPSTQQNSQPFAYPSTHQNTQRTAYPSTQQNSQPIPYPSSQLNSQTDSYSNLYQGYQPAAYPSTHQRSQPITYSGLYLGSQPVTSPSTYMKSQTVAHTSSYQTSQPVFYANTHQISQPFAYSGSYQSSTPVPYSGSYLTFQPAIYPSRHQVSQPFSYPNSYMNSVPATYSGSYQSSQPFTNMGIGLPQSFQPVGYAGPNQPSLPTAHSHSKQISLPVTYSRAYQSSPFTSNSGQYQYSNPVAFSGLSQSFQPVQNTGSYQNFQPAAHSGMYQSSLPVPHSSLHQTPQTVAHSALHQTSYPHRYSGSYQSSQPVQNAGSYQNFQPAAYSGTYQSSPHVPNSNLHQSSQTVANSTSHQSYQAPPYSGSHQSSKSVAHIGSYQSSLPIANSGSYQRNQPQSVVHSGPYESSKPVSYSSLHHSSNKESLVGVPDQPWTLMMVLTTPQPNSPAVIMHPDSFPAPIIIKMDELTWLADVTNTGTNTITLPFKTLPGNKTYQLYWYNQTNESFRECRSKMGGDGYCQHLSQCSLSYFKGNIEKYEDFFCEINNYAGVCCPKTLFSQQSRTTLANRPII